MRSANSILAFVTGLVAAHALAVAAYAQRAEFPPHPLWPDQRDAKDEGCELILPPGVDASLWNSNLWPGGNVYYTIDANVTQENSDRLRIAMDETSTVANVTFIPRNGQPNWVHIQNSTVNSAQPGMIGGQQSVNILSWPSRYIIIHELMHALGVGHEHSRADRDTYVIINKANIDPGFFNPNFVIQAGATPTGPYDFESIMHYSRCAATTCFCNPPTCTAIDPRPGFEQFANVMGNRSYMSQGDKDGLVSRYGNPLDDAYEPNDTQLTAAVLPVNSATALKLLDDDFFIVPETTAAISTVNITATAPGVWAPSNASVQLLNAAGTVLTTSDFVASDASGPDAVASISGTFASGPLVVRVSRTQPWGGTYSLMANTTRLFTLATFDGTNGSGPLAGLTLYGSTLYGTTAGGGAVDRGTVFSLPAAGGTPTTLATFDGTNGAAPLAGLTLSGTTLYGTTASGGAFGAGSVFSLPIVGGTPTTLATFNDTNGAYLEAGLALSGNTLYGTTVLGGGFDFGTIFSVPVAGGPPTTLAEFNGNNGRYPQAGLILSGNTLYGTTKAGGISNSGTVFSVPVTGGTPTTLVSFNGTNGAAPFAGLTLSGNTLYGTTAAGGAGGRGTVFSLPLTGGTPTTLVSFNGTNGAAPTAGLVLSGTTFYGTTSRGGASDRGTVFSVPVNGGQVTTLATFFTPTGNNPRSGLTLSGNTLFGTTSATVFAIVIPYPCTADLDHDGVVNVSDLTFFLGRFGTTVPSGSGADLNSDGVVNVADLTRFLGRLGRVCP